ncbi:hypothetical protein CYMTET_31719, partial [Cymbomonas tetramitiformis]
VIFMVIERSLSALVSTETGGGPSLDAGLQAAAAMKVLHQFFGCAKLGPHGLTASELSLLAQYAHQFRQPMEGVGGRGEISDSSLGSQALMCLAELLGSAVAGPQTEPFLQATMEHLRDMCNSVVEMGVVATGSPLAAGSPLGASGSPGAWGGDGTEEACLAELEREESWHMWLVRSMSLLVTAQLARIERSTPLQATLLALLEAFFRYTTRLKGRPTLAYHLLRCLQVWSAVASHVRGAAEGVEEAGAAGVEAELVRSQNLMNAFRPALLAVFEAVLPRLLWTSEGGSTLAALDLTSGSGAELRGLDGWGAEEVGCIRVEEDNDNDADGILVAHFSGEKTEEEEESELEMCVCTLDTCLAGGHVLTVSSSSCSSASRTC